ncbi:hypothetical protein QBC43DRAFT_117956 [Cladorrhinum sp. PSN259]|nr:hypothetical protein QBC43DRAFT_117956 [Cladorrhinum sp. PSN259]
MEWTERGTSLVIFAVVIVTISAFAVCLRFISRGYLVRKLGFTDWFILLTLCSNVANTITIIFHIPIGLGRHFNELNDHQQQEYFKAMFIGVLIGNTSNILSKISILFLFLDVFVLPTMRRTTLIVMAVVAAYGIYLTFSHVFYCVPIYAFWDVHYQPRKCLNGFVKWLIDSSLNIVLDFTIFCLPFPFLNYMTLPWKQKLWLHVVFAVGFFVCVVSIIRLAWLCVMIKSPDQSYQGVHIAYWSTLEMNLACIVACIPTYKPLINRFCPRLLASTPPNPTLAGFDGQYGVLDNDSHPPTISSGPSRLRQDAESELQIL